MSARVRPRSIQRDRLPARCRAGGVRHGDHDGAGAVRHSPADRREPRRAARRLRPRRIRRRHRPRGFPWLRPRRAWHRFPRGAHHCPRAGRRLHGVRRGRAGVGGAFGADRRLRFRHRLLRRRRRLPRDPRSLRFRLRLRSRDRTLLPRHRARRPAAATPRPALPATPWRLPAYAPVRRGR